MNHLFSRALFAIVLFSALHLVGCGGEMDGDMATAPTQLAQGPSPPLAAPQHPAQPSVPVATRTLNIVR